MLHWYYKVIGNNYVFMARNGGFANAVVSSASYCMQQFLCINCRFFNVMENIHKAKSLQP